MADPLSALAPRFDAALVAAFGADVAGTDPVLRPSDRDGIDVQANAAMALAKRVGRPSREVAEALVGELDLAGVAAAVEIAGPGFINVVLDDAFIVSCLPDAGDDRLGVAAAARPETVVVDYSSPTVTKEMHVGHLRSTIIGDALARVLRFLGHAVVRHNHYGDWGTQFGMLIEHRLEHPDRVLDDLNEFYKAANERFTADTTFTERARRRVVSLQAGDAESLEVWRSLVEEADRHNVAVYRRLGVLLDAGDVRPESAYNPMLADVAAELEAAGVAVVDEGALCVFVDGFDAPLIIRKSDGGYTYGTTDLAAVRYRTRDVGATRLLYVVDARQAQHLTQVFRAAERAGWLVPPARAEHVSFGAVLGADGRPLKSRAGETPRLTGLLDEAIARAEAVVAEKNPDLDAGTRAEVARMVGVGAVKYADLSNDRVKDYVFDFDRMLSFDGNTAPYLQYAHARIRSIFRRTDAAPGGVVIGHPAERALALQLTGFDPAVRATAEALQPHRLGGYLFDLASTFTAFYEACPVLRAEDDAVRASRLTLCDLTARTLAAGLDLLGIEAPDQM